MSVQGYTVSFVSKKKGHLQDKVRHSYGRLLASLDDLRISTRLFMPSGTRESDQLAIKSMDNDLPLRVLKNSLQNVLDYAPCRVICAPASELKLIQGEILRELERIPVHRAAHGFVRGRNSLSCAQAHLSYWGPQPKGLVLLNADVSGFFHSISKDMVITALSKHGLSDSSASEIVRLCMMQASPELALESIRNLGIFTAYNRTELKAAISELKPVLEWDNPVIDQYRHMITKMIMGLGASIQPNGWFLPQGAPTSPILSNLVCKIVDIRLTAMAKAFGAFYTRYADDVTFSWPAFTKGKVIDSLKRCSAEVFSEYGMAYHPKKIRVVGPGGSQDIVGFVINSGKPTVSQKFRKRMRAEVCAQQKSRIATPQSIINRLIGQAGYIQPLHPKEALWIKEQVEDLQYKTNRKVRISNATETIESTTTTSNRKVSTVN